MTGRPPRAWPIAWSRPGSIPEAAGCFSQLALGYLDEGNVEEAVSNALQAVALAGDEPALHLNLVRCLLEHGDKDEAIVSLRTLIALYLKLGQLEDARGTCLKILELDPANADARSEMARIFSQAERDPASEDVVVCIQCGHVNHREAATCTSCASPLRLTCQSCHRVVGISDKLCIFCGANPHAGGRRTSAGSPGTSRIIDPSQVRDRVARPGAAGIKAQMEEQVRAARELEQASDFPAALAQWQEVAKYALDNPELQTHIQELQARINDTVTEQLIERGHHLRRNRHYWRAMGCYRGAMANMASHDPRLGGSTRSSPPPSPTISASPSSMWWPWC